MAQEHNHGLPRRHHASKQYELDGSTPVPVYIPTIAKTDVVPWATFGQPEKAQIVAGALRCRSSLTANRIQYS
eukprot:6892666-Lingulodinium_polyedra.AAC.1